MIAFARSVFQHMIRPISLTLGLISTRRLDDTNGRRGSRNSRCMYGMYGMYGMYHHDRGNQEKQPTPGMLMLR